MTGERRRRGLEKHCERDEEEEVLTDDSLLVVFFVVDFHFDGSQVKFEPDPRSRFKSRGFVDVLLTENRSGVCVWVGRGRDG